MSAAGPSAVMPSGEPAWPADAVEVGLVLGAWGIKGGIRVKPFSSDPQALFSSKRWFIQPAAAVAAGVRPAATQVLRIANARTQGDSIVATLHDVDDRTQAEALKGARIFIARSSFPTADADEFYWVDLIGLTVLDRQGQTLGRVSGLLETGAHCVLQVAPVSAADDAPGPAAPMLIPFVGAYVDEVDLAGKRIVVDWAADY